MFLVLPSLSRRHPAIKITDVDYADDLAIVTDKTSEATILLHKIENTAKDWFEYKCR